MALQLAYPDPESVAPIAAAYFRVDGIAVDLASQRGQVVVNVYRSADDRAAGKDPVRQKVYQVGPTPGDDGTPAFAALLAAAKTTAGDPAGTLAFDLIRRTLYNWLKSRPEFAGSADV